MGPLGAVDGIDPKPFAIAIVGGLLLSGVAVGVTSSNIRNVRAVAASKMASVTGTSTPNVGGGDVSTDDGGTSVTGTGTVESGTPGEMQGATGDPNKVSDTSQMPSSQQSQQQQVPINQQPAQSSQPSQSSQRSDSGVAGSEMVPVKSGPVEEAGNNDVVLHVVSSGESIEGLAVKYGSSVEAILAANGLEGASGVPVGTRLVLPVTDPGAADAWGLG